MNKEKDQPKFAIGDVVILKSGGPPMTVEGVGADVSTCWFGDTGQIERAKFSAAALERGDP